MGSTSKEARSPLSLRKHRGCGHGLAGRAFTQEQLWFHVQRMGFSFPFILSVLSVQRTSFFGGSEGVAEGSSAHGGLPVRNMLLDHFGISSVHPLRQDPWLYAFTDAGISMCWQCFIPFYPHCGQDTENVWSSQALGCSLGTWKRGGYQVLAPASLGFSFCWYWGSCLSYQQILNFCSTGQYGCKRALSFPRTTLHALPHGLPFITTQGLWASSTSSTLASSGTPPNASTSSRW